MTTMLFRVSTYNKYQGKLGCFKKRYCGGDECGIILLSGSAGYFMYVNLNLKVLLYCVLIAPSNVTVYCYWYAT
jgi:hypothetical protein